MPVLKPDFVNEIEFLPETNRRDEVISPYKSDYRARVSLKINNSVKEVVLAQNSEYISSQGRYGTDDYKDSYTKKWSGLYYRNDDPFQELVDAGFNVDYSEIVAQYDAMVEKAKERQKQLDEEKEARRIIAAKEEYKNAWIHSFRDTVFADKNKAVAKVRDSVEFTPSTEELFLKQGSLWVVIKYKDYNTAVKKNDGKYEWEGSHRLTGEVNEEGKPKKVYESINYGKRKRLKWEGSITQKFVEAVDDEIASNDSAIKRKAEEKQSRQNVRKILKDASGYPVTILMENKWERNRYGSGPRSWIEYSYMIITELKEDKWSKHTGVKVDTFMETEYKDGKRSEIGRAYKVGGFKVNVKQFRGILDILLEGKEAIDTKKPAEATK